MSRAHTFARSSMVVILAISILAMAGCGGGSDEQAPQIQSEQVNVKGGIIQGFTQGEAHDHRLARLFRSDRFRAAAQPDQAIA